MHTQTHTCQTEVQDNPGCPGTGRFPFFGCAVRGRGGAGLAPAVRERRGLHLDAGAVGAHDHRVHPTVAHPRSACAHAAHARGRHSGEYQRLGRLLRLPGPQMPMSPTDALAEGRDLTLTGERMPRRFKPRCCSPSGEQRLVAEMAPVEGLLSILLVPRRTESGPISLGVHCLFDIFTSEAHVPSPPVEGLLSILRGTPSPGPSLSVLTVSSTSSPRQLTFLRPLDELVHRKACTAVTLPCHSIGWCRMKVFR